MSVKLKTYQVKIDRKSIKANEDAGETSIHELISTTATITVSDQTESLEKFDERIRLTHSSMSVTSKSKAKSTHTYMLHGSHAEIAPLIESIHKKYPKASINFRNNFQEVNFLTPIPPYSYEYRKTKVRCQHCKASFTHDKLTDNDDWDDFGFYQGHSNICPKCGKDEACKLEFESFEGIMLKKAGVPALVVGGGR